MNNDPNCPCTEIKRGYCTNCGKRVLTTDDINPELMDNEDEEGDEL